jgi:predicted Fe-Mo cluster-binding NifX family protein
MAHGLEDEIQRRFPRVLMVRVKTHPRQPQEIRRVTPVKGPEGLIETHFAKAPWFRLETIDRASQVIISQEYIQNPHCEEKTKKGLLVGRWLLNFKPDQVIVAQKKEGTALALLKEAGVEITLSTELYDL